MGITGQDDHYAVRLAGDLLKSCQNGTAAFLNPTLSPYYTRDMFTGRVLDDAGQLQTLLNNAAYGSRYINYAPTYILQETKRSWIKNLKKDDREIGCVIYKGLDQNGNKHYEMMSPVKKYNPGGINESPMTQIPVPDIGIFRRTPGLDPADPKSIEKYLTDVIGNYFNAAFTKTPYYPPQWGGRETEMLSKALNADPSMAIRAAARAYSQATSVKMENTANPELNDNIREAVRLGLPPFNTKKTDAVTGLAGAGGSNIPVNGIDFFNAYYGGKNAAETVIQNGYIPYQTHNEKPKDIDGYLVEQFGNIMNAALTGTPYSGSLTQAQYKALSSGLEAKMAADPAYMSAIVNKAHQNVLGFTYLPFDKDDFITKARDPSSREFKLLDQIIAGHINDICKRNKVSFNGEFEKLSGELTESVKKTAAETKKTATKTAATKKTETAASKKAAAPAKDTAAKTTASKTTAANNTKKTSTGTTATKTTASKTTTPKTTSTKTTASKTETPKTEASKTQEGGAEAAKKTETSSVKTGSAKTSPANGNGKPAAGEYTATDAERPSFFKEVTGFVNRNIIERKPALVLVDTLLGTVIDKAKKIVRTNKPVAAAFDIATAALTPNIQWKTSDYPLKNSAVNKNADNAARGRAGQAEQLQRTAGRAARR